MEEYSKIVLKSGKDQSVMRFHPWVFSGAIKKTYGPLAEGNIVSVFNNKDELLGLGHYQIGSIAVRIFAFENIAIDEEFWKSKIKKAIQYRIHTGVINMDATNTFRLIYAEGDGMPGLIADYYNGTIVMQMHSIGFYKIRELLAKIFSEIDEFPVHAVYNKSAATLPKKADIEPEDGYLSGNKPDREVLENGHTFLIDWEKGQKTGFFIDQRENRKLLASYSTGKKVLNMFCYTGGFSVYALKSGAELVHSVDSSKPAIDQTERNIEANFGKTEKHKSFAVDAFEYMRNSELDYDVVVLDPPAFAKHHNVLLNALQGYKKLNQAALEKMPKGSILFTYSCSQVVSKENFRKSVFAAAANAKRNVRIMHQMSQPIDHPVNIFHPESEYLKGLVLFVE